MVIPILSDYLFCLKIVASSFKFDVWKDVDKFALK